MKSDNITFVIPTFNEEARIDLALRNVHGWGQILVVDNFSTDRTLEIAKQYTDRIVYRRNVGHADTQEGYEFFCSHVDTPWMCRLYAGEFMPRRLLETLVEVASEGRFSVVCMGRKAVSYGRETPRRGGGYHPRCAKKKAVSFEGSIIHGIGVPTAPRHEVLRLSHDDDLCVWQFRDYDVHKTETTFTTYLDLDARERHEARGERFSVLKAVLGTAYVLAKTGIGQGAIFDGWPGFSQSVWSAMYYFNRQARLWELDNGWSLERVRAQHQSMRARLVEDVERGS